MYPDDRDLVRDPVPVHAQEGTLNWKRATMLIWEADDSELALIIDLVVEHENQTGRIMTAKELRAKLHRPGS